MYQHPSQQYAKGAISPISCIKTGWQLIKDQYWLFLGISFVGMLLGGAVPFGLLLGAMMCGINLCLFRKMKGEIISFDMLFKGFDYLLQSFILTLIQIVPVIVLMVPVIILFALKLASSEAINSNQDFEIFLKEFLPIIIFVVLIVTILSVILYLLFFFAYPLIVDRKLSAVEAIKLSAQAAINNVGGLLGLMAISICLQVIGVLACYIGAVFIMPITLAANAVAYRQVFPEK